jgi:hypothetical protein
VGIKSLTSKVEIYPNPASTKIIIEGENIVEVEVYNIVGLPVETQKGNIKNIDVSKYNLGTYIFKIYDANNNIVS